MEKMNDLWNSLKQSVADRERKLEKGLLQSGKFQEALNGLLAWMDEMDDMIANQVRKGSTNTSVIYILSKIAFLSLFVSVCRRKT